VGADKQSCVEPRANDEAPPCPVLVPCISVRLIAPPQPALGLHFHFQLEWGAPAQLALNHGGPAPGCGDWVGTRARCLLGVTNTTTAKSNDHPTFHRRRRPGAADDCLDCTSPVPSFLDVPPRFGLAEHSAITMGTLTRKITKFWDPVDINRDIQHVRVSQTRSNDPGLPFKDSRLTELPQTGTPTTRAAHPAPA
jgi:hypothetical protein